MPPQDPSNKRRIKLDDKLSTIFPGKSVDMFSMNKHLSKHCFTSGEPSKTREWEQASGDCSWCPSTLTNEAGVPGRRAGSALNAALPVWMMSTTSSLSLLNTDVLGGSESERSGSEEEEEEEEKEAHRPKRARAAASKISSGKKAGSEAKKSGGSSSSQKRSRRRKSSGEGGEEGTPRVSGFTKPCKSVGGQLLATGCRGGCCCG